MTSGEGVVNGGRGVTDGCCKRVHWASASRQNSTTWARERECVCVGGGGGLEFGLNK